jgi:Spy/CpxP family protein refolding chaperone
MALSSKLTRAGLTFGLLASFSVPVFAQQPQSSAPDSEMRQGERGQRHRRKRGGDMAFARILGELELTEAQKHQARTIIDNHVEAIKPQREELFRLREQREQGANQADLQPRAKALREQIHESTKNMRAQLLSILTPDQRARFDQMETEFKARRAERRERHRGMRDRDNEQPRDNEQ